VEVTTQKAMKRLKQLREDSGLLQKEFAQKFGVSSSTYNRYEKGEVARMPHDFAVAVGKVYNISPSWIMGFDDEKFVDAKIKCKTIPVFNKLLNGVLFNNQEDVRMYIPVPTYADLDFGLVVEDNSMSNERIMQGDLAYVRRLNQGFEDGDIVVVFINNQNACLRKYYSTPDGGIFLQHATGHVFTPKKEIKTIEFLGRVAYFTSEVKDYGQFPQIEKRHIPSNDQ